MLIVVSGGCLRAGQDGAPARPVMRRKREQLCCGGELGPAARDHH